MSTPEVFGNNAVLLMKLIDLAESYVLSITKDQANLWFEMTVLTDDGQRYRIFASNHNGSPIVVEVGMISLKAGFTSSENIPSLGELESIELRTTGVCLEGDFGDITIFADNINTEKLQ